MELDRDPGVLVNPRTPAPATTSGHRDAEIAEPQIGEGGLHGVETSLVDEKVDVRGNTYVRGVVEDSPEGWALEEDHAYAALPQPVEQRARDAVVREAQSGST